MSKGPYSVKPTDIKRVIRAAREEGIEGTLEVDLARRCIRIIPVKPQQEMKLIEETVNLFEQEAERLRLNNRGG
jgi:hypothetical protein